jgi:hypothetical protein
MKTRGWADAIANEEGRKERKMGRRTNTPQKMKE